MVAGLEQRFDSIDRHFELLHAEMRGLRSDFAGLQRQLVQIGWGLVGVLVSALVAVVVALG